VNADATADDISENIESIRVIKDGTYPMNNADEFVIIQQALQGE
jgi:predicted  nucleic acid-binding Zn-ribbon protein